MLVCIMALTSCARHPSTTLFTYFKKADVTWKDTKWCVPLQLKIVLGEVSRKFGPVLVYSTFRWPGENRRKGGKPKSFHLKCRAVDFMVPGNPEDVVAYLKAHPGVGGYSHYVKQGFYHIDNGPRRTWSY